MACVRSNNAGGFGSLRPVLSAHEKTSIALPKAPTPSPTEWDNFKPRDRIPINHPWLSRYCPSALLFFDGSSQTSNLINTATNETFGDSHHPLAFRIGCGKISHAPLIKALCTTFIASQGSNFSIGLVQNNSRQTLAALLADIVQISLISDPPNSTLAMNEGWCQPTSTLFNDHSILVGCASDPANLYVVKTLTEALQTLMTSQFTTSEETRRILFHSCGDGSATFYRKLHLWHAAGIDSSNAKWAKTFAKDPYDALVKSSAKNTYVLTERSTYLLAKDKGLVPGLRVAVEGDPVLVVPCGGFLNRLVPESEEVMRARMFAEWLQGEEAREIVRGFGKGLSYAKALFTGADELEFAEGQALKGRGI